MSAIPEQVVPRLHLSLREARQEFLALHELAVELADALDHEVDARHGVCHRDRHKIARALLKARRAGLL